MSDDNKRRGPEYVPAGPVRIRSTSVVADPLQPLIDRIAVLESQVKSLQMSALRGIPE